MRGSEIRNLGKALLAVDIQFGNAGTGGFNDGYRPPFDRSDSIRQMTVGIDGHFCIDHPAIVGKSGESG